MNYQAKLKKEEQTKLTQIYCLTYQLKQLSLKIS